MRSKLLGVIALVIFALMFSACKSNSTTAPATPSSSSNYYPNSDGSSYKYDVTRTDSSGNQTSGTRTTNYSGTTVLGGTTYQNEIDTLTFGGFSQVFTSLFLKNDTGVMFALDTTGLSSSIPDSLLSYHTFDASLKVLSFPFQDGGSWPVFNMRLKFGSLSINLVTVTAYYMGTEPVTLNLNSGTVTNTAAKIKYDLKLSIPNLNNPLAAPAVSDYIAYAWLVQNIGVVKWEGNGAITGAFTGSGISFSDTTSTVTQSLVSYSIK